MFKQDLAQAYFPDRSKESAGKLLAREIHTNLFDHHLSLYFQVNDIFHSSNTHTVSTNPYYAEDYSWSYNSRYVSLGLTWRIGKMDLESKGRQGAAY